VSSTSKSSLFSPFVEQMFVTEVDASVESWVSSFKSQEVNLRNRDVKIYTRIILFHHDSITFKRNAAESWSIIRRINITILFRQFSYWKLKINIMCNNLIRWVQYMIGLSVTMDRNQYFYDYYNTIAFTIFLSFFSFSSLSLSLSLSIQEC